MPAKVIPVGEPVNESERLAIAHLRDRLPTGYAVIHNFEIRHKDTRYEVDLAVVAPHALYLVDVKGTRGRIEVDGSYWCPEGRQCFKSPLLKLRGHARALKGLIVDSDPARHAELGRIFVGSAVILAAPDAAFDDRTGRDADEVVRLDRAVAFFTDPERVPSRFDRSVGKLLSAISNALKIVVRKPKGPARYGNWEVKERISGGEGYTEYRAANPFAGARAGTVRLRVYRADPYQDASSREAERRLIGNAYRALSRLPPHANIVGARDFFPLEDESGYVLVTDDVPSSALRLHLERPALALTLDQKLRVAEELLSALAHAHAHGVVHRNICPATVLLGQDGHTRLLGFDYARAVPGGSQTVAEQVAAELDRDYQAPELSVGPSAATGASDVFSAGLVLYELFAGERPFDDFTAMFALSAVFPQGAGDLAPGLPEGLGAWLQSLCTFQIDARPSAAEALAAFRPIVTGQEQGAGGGRVDRGETPGAEGSLDYLTLKPGTRLGQKFVVVEQLGRPGAFGVVYKVVDTFGDVTRVLKLILRDRESTLDRLKKEYQTLLRVPEHPNVVKVVDADVLPGDRTPYLVFEYVDGLDVADMVQSGPMDPEDALALGRQVAAGLDHLHRHDVYHCDIKPGNLLWTDAGVRIIDFNVAVHTQRDEGLGGGTRRYVPPDFDAGAEATPETLADRDLYALGVTLFEVLTGRPPWDGMPSLSAPVPDPRGLPACDGLDGALAELVRRLISPRQADRPASAAEVLDALKAIPRARRVVLPAVSDLTGHRVEGIAPPGSGGPATPGNPFVDYLLTLYSQSRTSNAGTRGLDALGKRLYVETALDEDLVEAVLAGGLRLVVVTGNAGDGKTAFLQVLEQRARKRGAAMDPPRVNGCRFTLDGRVYLSNYDGSQDEGERSSDSVLLDFFAPLAGPLQADGTLPAASPSAETRLIAINEGRLIDFLETYGADFAGLAQVVRRGLATGARQDGIAVVNLNLRSIVALPRPGSASHKSLLRRMIEKLVDPARWGPCETCELARRCYVRHNVLTFQDATGGERVIDRLETLYALTHLRGRLHITLRDLRSALAFMLAGTRNCAEIHALYATGDAEAVLQGFYFNSWMGGDGENRDRLLTLLKQVDMGRVPDPRLDRGLDFVSPGEEPALYRFAERGGYDLELLQGLFDRLPRGYQGNAEREAMARHRRYLAMARRRQFFERRDPAVAAMLPYRAGIRMLGIIRGEVSTQAVLPELIDAINRGEGLADTERLGGQLALQVRRVDKGTIKSFRLFPRERFSLEVSDEARDAEFIEHMPSRLVLRYRAEHGADPRLPINLDIFEMLQRLNQGYCPGVEESQGFYMGLEVFKNLLGSAPYQEVLLTTSGHDFYRIRREPTGRLVMDQPALEIE